MNEQMNLFPLTMSHLDMDIIVLSWAREHWHDARVTWDEHRGYYYAEWAKEHKKLQLPKTEAASQSITHSPRDEATKGVEIEKWEREVTVGGQRS